MYSNQATVCNDANENYEIANTVKTVADGTHPLAQVILDRSQNIDLDFVRSVVNRSIFSWEGRHPTPALDEAENFIGTDLDLLSFMVPLVTRGAVIELPTYKSRRPVVKKASERKVGQSRFGQITGLTSNQDVFSFSVRIRDQSVIAKNLETEQETVGAWRNYMLVDCDGRWHDGWNSIVWDPSRAENAFLAQNKLWTSNSVSFKYYVHPNRRQSVFGAPYLLLKMLSNRITDEAKFYRREMQRLEALGFTLPQGEKAEYEAPVSLGSTEKIAVETLEMVLDMPRYRYFYSSVSDSEAGLVEAYHMHKLFTYTLKPLVQFVIRADEAAYFQFGHKTKFVAHWMGQSSWESGYRTPRGRTDWNRMVLSNKTTLRYRIKTVTEEVSAE
ncbi:hypothetical protein KC872_04490 [Candidatus Kaiserbacteria bacterium]|nr:hypothetical protein [Candidatus Kaiserbacteria bacterium]